MRTQVALFAAAVLFPVAAQGQSAQAVRAPGETPAIDGRLDDAAWQLAPAITDFRQKNPTEGAPASEQTEVRFLYTDHDLYVGLRAYDREPKRIFGPLVRRDPGDISSDYFAVYIDSYHDRRTAYEFDINPAGSRSDVFIYDDGARRDDSWDPVYDWAASVDDKGWSAELKIPFSQLRFARRDSLIFGLRVKRLINRLSEESNWPFIPRDQAGEVSHYADLEGLIGVPAPRRLEVLPYTAGSRSFEPNVVGDPLGSRSNIRSGGDVKVGLTSGLTMDVTINPDFGQVEADPAVVNLTGFETFYAEKRPFFIEGTDLLRFTFSSGFFGDEGLVYTRRIGRDPQIIPSVTSGAIDAPSQTTILGAAKITGQLGHGWALGAAQALTSKERGHILSPTGTRLGSTPIEPFSSYSVIRLQRTTPTGRLTYGLIGTGVARSLDDAVFDSLNRSAASAGADIRGRFAKDAYEYEAKFLGTRVAGTRQAMLRSQTSLTHAFQRPDQDYFTVDSTRTSLTGFAANARIAKVTGFLTWFTRLTTRSPGLESNDLGYLRRGDMHQAEAQISLRWLKPGKVFRRSEFILRQDVQATYGWELGNTTTEGRYSGTFLNYWNFNQNVEWEPAHVDPRALRGGPGIDVPAHYHFIGGINSDPRHPFTTNVSWQTTVEDESGRKELTLNTGVTYRPPGPVALTLTGRRVWREEPRQYLLAQAIGGSTRYLLSRAKYREVALALRAEIAMTPRLSLQLYGQPFASARNFTELYLVPRPRQGVKYQDQFDVLGPDRLTRPFGSDSARIDVNRDGVTDISLLEPNRRLLSLRTTAVLRWEFRPGSTLFLVWSQNRAEEEYTGTLHDLDNLGGSFGATGHHVLAIKVAYWIGL